MKRLLPLLLFLIPLVSSAGNSTYLCTIKQVLELSDNGLMKTHTGMYADFFGKQFSINRNTGEMIGRPFATEFDKQITVIDKGSRDNGYKAIVLSGPPNIWVKYIYVAEHHKGKDKAFWGTDDAKMIYSGICE